ncbi:GTPase activating protein for Arf [Sarocladium implicatum]|nr:GTPase activating protein for Arf [Sarocladium implicatum]
MSSKRQQARNEQALKDLVHNVAGNNICADCHTRNPSWASWSLGVFLCMRCAAIHRKLGTHISKVKSLSMDSWSNEQVDNMRKVGNVVSNQIYNPDNKKPPVPIDADEADSAMERFIRQKYTNNVVSRSSNPSSPRSDEGTPPPLPPKNSKFGFRSATSSLFPMSRSKKDKLAQEARSPTSSNLTNKPSKVFGTTVDYDGADETEKMTRLRDMGFHDTQRNTMVLKGVNGDLGKAIEALVRLGEGDRRSPAGASPVNPPPLRSTKSLTPLSTSNSAGISIGLSVGNKANSDRPFTPSSANTTSNNPYDAFPTAQPQTAQSTGSLQNNNPYHAQSTNPFGPVRQNTEPLTQAFQNLNVTPTQPLFPNHTGGIAAQQPSQQVIYHQPVVPSLPSSPQNYQGLPFPTMGSMTYPQPAQQPIQQQPSGYNPFFTNTQNAPQAQQLQMQQMPQQNLSLNMGQSQQGSNNPFARSPTRIASPTILGQIPEQSQSTFQSMSPVYQQPPQQQAMSNNPFFSSTTTQSPGQMAPQQQYFTPQRPDKASIMALYGQSASSPQPTMSPVPQVQQQQQQHQQSASPSYATFAQQQNPSLAPEPSMHLQRSQTAPVAPIAQATPLSPTQPMSSNNPFMTASNVASAAAPTDPFAAGRHVTRESIILGNDMAWANGRHSPDAFASLSARHV